jgi:AraC family transcriptional regulator, regulatory protein of adaptative response / methylated-DNA-[protein]-cysteine methyltransferase
MNSETLLYRVIDSPIGDFVAGATSKGCCVYEFLDRGGFEKIKARIEKRYKMDLIKGSNEHIDVMVLQVKEYFAGKRSHFSLTLDVKGTAFEMAVWEQVLNIPYGETRSYGQIAVELGVPGAARAVGRANGANYLPIIIPCHRVINADGSLRGYGGGLWRKKYLLDFEKRKKHATLDLFQGNSA